VTPEAASGLNSPIDKPPVANPPANQCVYGAARQKLAKKTTKAIPKTATPTIPNFQFSFESRNISPVERRVGHVSQRRWLAEFFRPTQLVGEHGHDLRHVELEQRGVIFHRAANVNRRGKHIEIPLFQRADVVGADFRDFRNLRDGEFPGFACNTELFSDR